MRCLLLCSTRKAFRGNFYGSHGFIVGYSLERIITKLMELCVNCDILVRNKSDIQSAVLYSVLGILVANQISQLICSCRCQVFADIGCFAVNARRKCRICIRRDKDAGSLFNIKRPFCH